MSPELSANEPSGIVIEKLNQILGLLKRMEERQIKTTALVEDVERQEQQQQFGSFGASEIPEEKSR